MTFGNAALFESLLLDGVFEEGVLICWSDLEKNIKRVETSL